MTLCSLHQIKCVDFPSAATTPLKGTYLWLPDQILYPGLNYSGYTICYFSCTIKSLGGFSLHHQCLSSHSLLSPSACSVNLTHKKPRLSNGIFFPQKSFFLLFMALTASFLLFCQQYICPICTKSNVELMNCYYYICYYTVRPRPRANISLTPRSRPLYFTALGSSLTCISIIITCIIYRCGDSYCLSLKVKKL